MTVGLTAVLFLLVKDLVPWTQETLKNTTNDRKNRHFRVQLKNKNKNKTPSQLIIKILTFDSSSNDQINRKTKELKNVKFNDWQF